MRRTKKYPARIVQPSKEAEAPGRGKLGDALGRIGGISRLIPVGRLFTFVRGRPPKDPAEVRAQYELTRAFARANASGSFQAVRMTAARTGGRERRTVRHEGKAASGADSGGDPDPAPAIGKEKAPVLIPASLFAGKCAEAACEALRKAGFNEAVIAFVLVNGCGAGKKEAGVALGYGGEESSIIRNVAKRMKEADKHFLLKFSA